MNKKELAKILKDSSKSRVPCTPLRDLIGTDTIDLAYEIQQINIKERIDKGAKMVGHKIGLTSEAVQQQLGVDQPDFGILLDDMEVQENQMLSFAELMQPKVEAEIAFVMAADLNKENLTEADIEKAIDFAQASIEIVGSRIENWNIKITDTVADNASASHFIVGSKKVPLDQFDLLNCKMELYKNGELASEGIGANCLGSPIKSTLWLAQKMQSMGQPIKKGDVVLTGALGPMVGVAPKDEFRVIIEGLGSVDLKVGH